MPTEQQVNDYGRNPSSRTGTGPRAVSRPEAERKDLEMERKQRKQGVKRQRQAQEWEDADKQ
eukprot:71560-Prorocentrum_lima.AAC.1